MSDRRFGRGVQLLQLGRSKDAVAEFEAVLAEHPSDARAHAFRALSLADLDELDEALESAQRATGEAPDWDFAHRAYAQVLLLKGRAKAALAAAEDAVSIDPEEPENHALVASAHLARSRWRSAADAADLGLALDPEHGPLLNLRATALRMLGASDGAEDALETALADDPENAWTLQNLGWVRLEEGDAAEAARLFREALRLDPESNEAREGLGTALKASMPLFAPLLAWQMLCARLSGGKGLALVLGFWFLNRAVQASSLGGTAVGTTLLVLYLSFAWMSWAGNALYDVALLARADTRAVLERRERVSALGVAALLALAIVAVVEAFALERSELADVSMPFLYAAGALAAAAIPAAGWSPLPNGKARATGATIAVVASGLALAVLALAHIWYQQVGAVEEQLVLGVGLVEGVAEPVELRSAEFGAEALRRAEAARTTYDRLVSAAGLSFLLSVGASWALLALGFVHERVGTRRRRPRT
ncbi:MAG: tetratricopeptide repeat protein [Planctomycetota bacterium]